MAHHNEKYQYAIDQAPGKELIREYLATGDWTIIIRFFQVRLEWCSGYPLIHDTLFTYGAFDDLFSVLDVKHRYALIPPLLQMAEAVDDRYFHCALFLLSEMIPDNQVGPRPTGFSDVFLRLRIRAEKLSFLPNLECAWDSFALKQRYLLAADDYLRKYTARQLGLTKRWKEFFPSPLVNYTKSAMSECAADMAMLHRKIQEKGCLPGEARLIYRTRIEDTRYWVWKLPPVTGPAHLYRLVVLRQPREGPLGIGHWDIYAQFHERDTPEQISERLMLIEFRGLDLEPVDRKKQRPDQM